MQPGLGHFTSIPYSLLLGAITATSEVSREVVSGSAEADVVGQWRRSFKCCSREAAQAMTPLGAHLLDEHLFSEDK